MKKIYNNCEYYQDFDENDLNAYCGLSKSTAYNNREYLNVEPGISVRPSFDRRDYEAFRPGEATATKQKRVMGECNNAYENLGIIKNIVDLMADFSSQGVTIVHPDPKIQNFYRAFYKQVDGDERTERFLNYFYRIGNVVVHRNTAKITKVKETEFKQSTAAADSIISEMPIYRREIPWSYEFINPIKIDIKTINGDKKYFIKVNEKFLGDKKAADNLDYLPDYLLSQIKDGKKEAELDSSKISIFHYKKDDWLVWANPMVHPILDDISMLNKMRMADLAALDGAISNIRLWTIGSLDHKIVPREGVINKLRNIIASNTGGGTFDLVWGPDLKFQESNSQVYKFLGEEKYKPVLNSIYQGLGISAAVTGSSGNASYTNNYVSIKVLIERLEYGRKAVKKFWDNEFRIVQKAMKFKEPARIHFDAIILADEAAIKTQLISLVDRSIMSEETLLERFKEMPDIEQSRLKRESRRRSKDMDVPRKASPFHQANHKEDIAKIALQSQVLGKEYFEEIGLPYQKPPVLSAPGNSGVSPAKKPKNPNAGRPLARKDISKRKTKRVLPKAKGYDANLFLWGMNAQNQISEILTPIFLSISETKNVRSLPKEQFAKLEQLKLSVFVGHEPFQEITEASIKQLISKETMPSQDFLNDVSKQIYSFAAKANRKPTIDELRSIYAIIFAQRS
jgi:hypothetical protein